MKRFIREEGQGLVEYSLILVLVAVLVIAVLLVMGPAIGNVFSNVVTSLESYGGGGSGSGGSITGVSVTASTTKVDITVTVSDTTTVSVSGDGFSGSKECPGSCTFSSNIPPAPKHGSATVSGGGSSQTATW